MRSKNYYYNKRKFVITYLTNDEFEKAINKFPVKNKYSWLRRKLIRGFTRHYGSGVSMIYIKDSVKIGKDRLILHEILHVIGYGHTWLPFLNNPTWLFRWIKYPFGKSKNRK